MKSIKQQSLYFVEKYEDLAKINKNKLMKNVLFHSLSTAVIGVAMCNVLNGETSNLLNTISLGSLAIFSFVNIGLLKNDMKNIKEYNSNKILAQAERDFANNLT